MGRPRAELIVTTDALARLTEAAARGVQHAQFAQVLEIDVKTWRQIRRRQPAVEEAIQEGRFQLLERLTNRLIDRAMKSDIALFFALNNYERLFGVQLGLGSESARIRVEILLPAALSPAEYVESLDVGGSRESTTSRASEAGVDVVRG